MSAFLLFVFSCVQVQDLRRVDHPYEESCRRGINVEKRPMTNKRHVYVIIIITAIIMRQLLVTANDIPSSPILVTLIMETICSS
jgi:hypothetical protein